jgi:hypothetical protein
MANETIYTNLSKDYARLYELIKDGKLAVGFVDYGVISIKGVNAGIKFGASITLRGTDLQRRFIAVCKDYNLEWVEND